MSDLGNFLGKVTGKIINIANSDRSLKCLRCNKITKHVHLSCADVAEASMKAGRKYNNKKEPSQAAILGERSAGVFLDIFPLVPSLIQGNPYACTRCKRIRYEGGITSNRDNEYLDKINVEI